MQRREFLRQFFGDENEWDLRDSRYDRRPGRPGFDHRRLHPLEGAGRAGWDTEQNRAYGNLYGNIYGPSSVVDRGEVKHFYGRGPKNYRRPDERIRDDIHDRLTDDDFIDASDVDVAVNGGEVVLTGHVEDREAKRRAEDLAESVPGVVHLENCLRVMR